MKRFIAIASAVLFMIPSSSYALDSVAYNTKTLKSDPNFKIELLNDVSGRNANVNIKLKNYDNSEFQGLFNYISKVVLYESNMDIYSVDMSSRSSGSTADISLKLGYRMDKTQSEAVNSWIKNTMDPFLATKPTQEAIIKFVNDTVVKHAEYDQSLQKKSAYNMVFDKTALCEGYASLTKMMLTYANIENKTISGKAGSENHIWNLVKYNNAWYHLDTTWNDPVFTGNTKKPEGFVSYLYYLKTNKEISKTHTWDKSIYPFVSAIS